MFFVVLLPSKSAILKTVKLTKNKPKAIVRYFDEDDPDDLKRLRKIVRSPGVKSWMEDLKGMRKIHFQEWMEEQGEEGYFLMAVCAESKNEDGMTAPQGFVYFYPKKHKRGLEEVSYGRKPHAIRGLMGSALRQACVKVRRKRRRLGLRSRTRILGEVDPNNKVSLHVLKSAGFEDTGVRLGKRDIRHIWELNWRRLLKKMREKGER